MKYKAASGELGAYLTKDPGDGKRHPAIIWLTGGDSNTIGPVWGRSDPQNDQNATAYREAGIVMMFPSLRGGNDNPGRREGFLGEIDDVLAAADYLEKQHYVDPERIYLGGHSTGGTLALLVTEGPERFRAAFAFGPVGDVKLYGGDFVYCDPEDTHQTAVRSPQYWLRDVESKLFVIEGATDGNADSLDLLEHLSKNENITFLKVVGADHFSVLGPVNALIAQKILNDKGQVTNIDLKSTELDRLFPN